MQQAAFFDLDKTVIAKSSTLAFTGKLMKAGLVRRRALVRAAIAQAFFTRTGADHQTSEKTREAILSLTKGWPRREVAQIVAEALFLIDEHLREGHRVVIISASPEEVVRPLADYIGVEEVVATRARVDENDCYTGEVEFYAYAEAKADEVRRLAAIEGIDLAESFAYSDSITDLPLLEAVGHPHAVNPDKDLRAIAAEREWPILEFRRQVTLASRLTGPVPIISGATLAALGGAAVAWLALRGRKR